MSKLSRKRKRSKKQRLLLRKQAALFSVCIITVGLSVLLVANNSSSAEVKGDSTVAKVESGSIATEPQPQADSFKEIEAIFKDKLSELNGTPSLVLIDLVNNRDIRINDQKVHVSASLYKLFTAYKTYEALHSGALKPTTRINSCLSKSIIVSDNACGVYLGDLLGWDDIDYEFARQGYDGTVLNNYLEGELYGNKITTAHDVASLLGNLYAGELLNKTDTVKFMDLLKQQEINDRIPSSLPKGVSFAHKTGNVEGRIHDAGFILEEGSAEYLYVILTDGWTTDEEGVEHVKKLILDIVYELY